MLVHSSQAHLQAIAASNVWTAALAITITSQAELISSPLQATALLSLIAVLLAAARGLWQGARWAQDAQRGLAVMQLLSSSLLMLDAQAILRLHGLLLASFAASFLLLTDHPPLRQPRWAPLQVGQSRRESTWSPLYLLLAVWIGCAWYPY
jgi:hypothetical protein